MKNIREEALDRISGIAWDENPDAEILLNRIQVVLYELEQIETNRSDMMFGDPESHINSPNMRRC